MTWILLLQAASIPDEGTRWAWTVTERTADLPTAERRAETVFGPVEDGWTEARGFLGYERCGIRDDGASVRLRIGPDGETLEILRREAAPGESWTGRIAGAGLRFTAAGTEEVELAGRRLAARRVVYVREAEPDDGPTGGTLWFAPGVGLVRAVVSTDLDCHSAGTTEYLRIP